MVDRGGLVHVTEGVYCFFHAVEVALRKHLKMKDAWQMTQGFKERLVASVTTNEDVLFYWCMITTLLEEEESDTLLSIILSHWVTVRGFSFANSFMEMYKQSHKKLTQRSKGIRKELFSSSYKKKQKDLPSCT